MDFCKHIVVSNQMVTLYSIYYRDHSCQHQRSFLLKAECIVTVKYTNPLLINYVLLVGYSHNRIQINIPNVFDKKK